MPARFLLSLLLCLSPLLAARQMEALDRGLIALPVSAGNVFLSWRLLGNEPRDTRFNVYRSLDGAAPQLLNAEPLSAGTCYTDTGADLTRVSEYSIRALLGAAELPAGRPVRLAAGEAILPYKAVPLQIPAALTMPDGTTCTYSANDCSTGDLDGDGQYELVVKWDPSNSKDNSQSGYTGNVYLDAYKLDGRLLWRIDLGRNVRAGAHYTQFMVYDLDGDGCAEVACRSSDATIDGTGKVIGDGAADHRNSGGYILKGPEYLSVFAGVTGAELARVPYAPTRVPSGALEPSTSEIKTVWGDNYGNRIDRFLACIAYLDGVHPSLVMCRGYYTRAVLVAYDFRMGALTKRWTFDSADGNATNKTYEGQGFHNLSVADVDGDGRDEIVYGSCTIDDNGTGLYNTRLGHGDAMHVTDVNPDRPGLEVWSCHEDVANNGGIGLSLRDARTGALLFSVPNTTDTGRAVCADIDPNHKGEECWGAAGGLYSATGTLITSSRPSMNFVVWWDGDLGREILDSNLISKWEPSSRTLTRLVTAMGCTSNNSTKSTPCLSADILGDWREEVVWRTTDSRELRIYSTTIPTTHRIPTLMHDPQYRLGVAWQNVAYNQPPYTGFYLGNGMVAPPMADISTEIDTGGARIVNLSARASTGQDQEMMVVGFYMGGGPMRALVRAIGPTLTSFGVQGAATDPLLDFYRSSVFSERNDNWGSHTEAGAMAALMTRTEAFPLAALSLDAALMPLLAAATEGNAGFTAEARNQGGSEGVALVEIYADPLTTQGRLVNVSARAFCANSFRRLVAGFSIKGDTPRRVLVRAVGPGLKPFGISRAMNNPFIELYRNQTLIHSNEDWAASQATAALFSSVGAFALPADSKDAALVVTLTPGVYTAEIYSRTGDEGVVLAEVYDLP